LNKIEQIDRGIYVDRSGRCISNIEKKTTNTKKKYIGLVQRPCNPCLFLDVYKRGPREYQTTSFHVHDFSLHHHTTAAVGKGFVVWKERRGSGKDQYTCDGCEVQSPPWNTAKATNMEHNKTTAEKEQCTYATMQVRLTFQFVVVPPLPIAHASAFL
jgi:hypothetical protein